MKAPDLDKPNFGMLIIDTHRLELTALELSGQAGHASGWTELVPDPEATKRSSLRVNAYYKASNSHKAL